MPPDFANNINLYDNVQEAKVCQCLILDFPLAERRETLSS